MDDEFFPLWYNIFLSLIEDTLLPKSFHSNEIDFILTSFCKTMLKSPSKILKDRCTRNWLSFLKGKALYHDYWEEDNLDINRLTLKRRFEIITSHVMSLMTKFYMPPKKRFQIRDMLKFEQNMLSFPEQDCSFENLAI